MTAAWLSSCTSTIQNFVETSTRLHHDKLVLTLQEQIDFDYQINLRLDFRVEAIRHSQAGRVTATRNKLIFFNLLQYAEALKAETRAVLSRQETLRRLVHYSFRILMDRFVMKPKYIPILNTFASRKTALAAMVAGRSIVPVVMAQERLHALVVVVVVR